MAGLLLHRTAGLLELRRRLCLNSLLTGTKDHETLKPIFFFARLIKRLPMEPVAAVAAVAACAQLLGQAINTTGTIAIFCSRIKDSPAELSRLCNDVIFTQQMIIEFRRSFGNTDDVRASEELARLVRSRLRDVNETLNEMCHNCSRWSSGGKPTLKTKVKLAFRSPEIATMPERLRDIRNDLMGLALLLNLCGSDYTIK